MDPELDSARTTLDHLLWKAVEEDPVQALRALAAVQRDIAAHIGDAVRAAVQTSSWAEIGEALGVSKQAVHQRFGKEWSRAVVDDLKSEHRAYKAARSRGTRASAAEARDRRATLIDELKRGRRH